MHHYIVLDTTHDGLVAVRDDLRQYHVARMHANVPTSGERLQGNAPGLGFCLLLSIETGKVYHLTFEQVDCGQDRTLALIHPETTLPAFWASSVPSIHRAAP